MKERRREPRYRANVRVQVSGLDANGNPFSEDATLADMSWSGALLSGLTHQPKCGDVIGIAYDGQKARFRAIWARRSDGEAMIQVAAHKLPQYACPWGSLLAEGTGSSTKRVAIPAVVSGSFES